MKNKMENMIPNPYPGKFIAFEGIDYSGKTTQSKMLAEKLIVSGNPTVWTCEPFHNISLKHRIDLTPFERQKFFVDDRHAHLVELIIPTLGSEKNLITDRYIFSTIAYGMSESIEQKKLLDLHEKTIGSNLIIPDITFLIDVPVDVALERLKERQKATGEEAHYFEKKDFLERIRDAYLMIYANKFYKEHGFDMQLIDGNRSREVIFAEILDKTMKLFKEK